MNNTKEQDYLMQHIISNVVNYIIEDESVSTEEALQIFFFSELSKKIEDVETGYYLESPSYIYEIFKEQRR